MQQFVPAAGQGILAVEIRQGELTEIMRAIHSVETEAELTAEREFLTILGGGCNAPCGAHCRLDEAENKLSMHVMYARDGVHPEYRSEAVLLDGSLKDLPEQQRKWEQAQTAATGAACAESTESVRMTLLTDAKKLARDLAVLVRCKPVYLVGAGPGDTGLFTEKGLDCVRRADVIVYDNLISGSILNEARAGCGADLRGEALRKPPYEAGGNLSPSGEESPGRILSGALKRRRSVYFRARRRGSAGIVENGYPL